MTTWVKRLIIANVVMFFLQMTVAGLTGFLVFVPRLVLVQPWTIVTYMFIHGGITHILFNMLGLYFFGPRVEDRIGSTRFIQLYMFSGIFGALTSLVFAGNAPILGASAAVFGVMLAFARYWPHTQILIWGIIPVEARLLVLITTVIAIFSGATGSGSGVAHFAHLGGYAGAWLYLTWLERTTGARVFRSKAVAKVPETALLNWKKVDPRAVHEVNRDEVNRILDKINQSGLGSLTPQERVFLSNFAPPDDRVPPVA